MLKRRPLIAFYIIAYAISWLFQIYLVLTTNDPIRSYVLIVVGMWIAAGIALWLTRAQLGFEQAQSLSGKENPI